MARCESVLWGMLALYSAPSGLASPMHASATTAAALTTYPSLVSGNQDAGAGGGPGRSRGLGPECAIGLLGLCNGQLGCLDVGGGRAPVQTHLYMYYLLLLREGMIVGHIHLACPVGAALCAGSAPSFTCGKVWSCCVPGSTLTPGLFSWCAPRGKRTIRMTAQRWSRQALRGGMLSARTIP
jgi:hypothetical protein